MKTLFKNQATHLIMILAMAFAFFACEEKKKPDTGGESNAQQDAEETLKAESMLIEETVTLDKDEDEDSEKRQRAHTIEFNGKEIPMTMFLSNELDSLVFQYDGVKQIVRFQGTEKVTKYEPERGDDSYEISAPDYNFDGYMDIEIESETGGDNIYHDVYMYNPKTKSYSRHEMLSDMCGVQFEPETQTIRDYSVGDVEGKNYSSSKYKWEKGQLVEFYSESRDLDHNLGKYILITRTLQNGNWIQQTDTVMAGDVF